MNERAITPVASEAPVAPSRRPDWDGFERGLASALSVLKDEFLVVSTRTGNRFVQFNASSDEGVFAEAVSNAFLDEGEKLDVVQLATLLSLGWKAPTHAPDCTTPVPPPTGSPNHFREFPNPCSCPEIARFAAATVTEAFRVESPAELQYRAFDADGHVVTLPSLPIEREPARPVPAKAPAKPRRPTELEKLRARVRTAARNGSGLASLTYGEDGTLLVPIGSRMGWIRVNEAPTYVRVHLHLLSDVSGGEELLAKIHELNSRLPMARVIYTGRSVFFGVDFPALPFRAEHLVQAVAVLAQFADDVLERLRGPGEPAKAVN